MQFGEQSAFLKKKRPGGAVIVRRKGSMFDGSDF
jgi:hypothetical protein